MIKKLCVVPACPNFRVDGSKYCEKHRTTYEQKDRERYQKYLDSRERTITPERQKFYGSYKWRERRKLFLQQNPWCSCIGCSMPSEEIHHDWPIGYDYWNEEDFFDETHWVAVCHTHHQTISRERRGS